MPVTGGIPAAVRGDRGAASLEYTGVLAVVAAVVTAVLLNITPVGGVLRSKICEAVGASCGTSASQQRADELTRCVTRRDDRTLAFGGNVRFFNADRKDGDRFTVFSDGSAAVALSQSTAAGVGVTGKKFGSSGEESPFSVDAKAQLAGDVAYLYNVPEAWGGEDTAQRILDDKAGTLDRYGNLVLGPWATSLEEGANRALDGLGNAWRWGTDKLGFHESAEDKAARERGESLSQADAMLVSLSLQGSAGVSADGGLVKGSATGTAAVRGTVQVGLNASGEDAAGSSFTGAVDLKGTLEGVVGWPGEGAAGQAPTRDIPAFLSGALVGGALWSYKVDYDSDGRPAKLTMLTETTGEVRGGLNPSSLGLPGGSSVRGKGGSGVGNAHVQEVVLDLAEPANRAAFEDLFATYGVGVGDHRAQVSQLSIFAFPELMDRAAALQERIAEDALVVDYDYDLTGTNVSAGGQQRQSGVDFVVGGVNWENSSLSRLLVGATAYDMRSGGVPFEIVNCGS